ncbi:MAG: DUF4124 domain-containing protein [Gammaproteobacteria bacterium]
MKRTMTGAAAALLALLLALPVTAPAQTVYQWVDENGVTVYGERPPPGVDAKQVTVEPAPAAPSPSPYARQEAETAPGEPTRLEQERQDRRERAQNRAEEQERLEAACAAARDFVLRVGSRPNVLIEDEDGNVTRMDDAERVQRVEEAEAFIRENCEDQ